MLSEHEALLNGVLESVPDGIATIRESGEIERINQAIGHMFGFPDEELIGTTLERLVPGALMAPVLAVARTRDSGEKAASVMEP